MVKQSKSVLKVHPSRHPRALLQSDPLSRNKQSSTCTYRHGALSRCPKIPAAALSSPDADLIEEIVKADKPVTIKLNLQNQFFEDKTSYNVIGEITGVNDHMNRLASAHLDSWDEGTGALDDGAGVGIVTAAAHLIQSKSSCPKRTIRVVLYAAEEIGLLGAKAYLEAHKEELKDHILATESDPEVALSAITNLLCPQQTGIC